MFGTANELEGEGGVSGRSNALKQDGTSKPLEKEKSSQKRRDHPASESWKWQQADRIGLLGKKGKRSSDISSWIHHRSLGNDSGT